ncbi:MAG: phosphoenolpyruvate--protein phosphotransferase [Clostridia bacterium]|nr:phosphoenolpyruvate--protein phosphotransferase [Clostridia bacterium]
MIVWKGIPICDGIAIRTAGVYQKNDGGTLRKIAENKEYELEKYSKVKTLAIDELESLERVAKREIGEKEAQIFSIHKMMVEDMYYDSSVRNIIEKQKMNAETAVLMTSKSFENMFNNMDNAYMRERAGDIKDVSDRIIALLRGKHKLVPRARGENTVIFSGSIAPSEALQMDRSKIVAFVTEDGTENSHTAILARALGIPAVSGINFSGKIDGKRVAVDGYAGIVYIEPDETVIKGLYEKEKTLQTDEPIRKSGKNVRLLAKISAVDEARNLRDFDGIGFFGSESLFSAAVFPSESYQFDAYRKLLERNKEVTICTLDIDAEKKGTFFGIFGEQNAAMGMRAIRLCLKYPQIFKTQLRAVLRASVCGKMRILLPMVVSEEEVIKAKKLILEVKEELKAEKTAFDDKIPIGVVIETPAAAIISDKIAPLCDFFLIDADSLAQFTLAMDRKNIALSDLFDRHHTAVTELIRRAAENGRKNGVAVELTGEITADSDKIPLLLEMGISAFALSPRRLCAIQKAISEGS